MDNATLLRAVSKGDDHALRELFELHAPWLASRLRRGMPPDAVEDVLQETFIAIWRGAHTYKGEGNVSAWIWGIARRQVAMWFRKRGRPEFELNLEAVATGDPAGEAVDKAELEQALALLGDADSEERELVRLAWEEGHSIAEMAVQMGIPQGTVKSRLHRVRRLLRMALR